MPWRRKLDSTDTEGNAEKLGDDLGLPGADLGSVIENTAPTIDDTRAAR
jgi:hypothetical protein